MHHILRMKGLKNKIHTVFGRRLPPLISILFILIASCNKNLIKEENQQIKNYSWDYADVKTFTVDINDTVRHYDISIDLRHNFNFDWRNLWVKIETVFPDGRQLEKRVNLVLSEPDGHWYGKCLGDNCDIRIPIQVNAIFPQTGKYIFKISQDMRVNPLPQIKSVGMYIEVTQNQ